MTHYERLGIAPTATVAQIRDAYRRAARAAHPDRNAGEGSEARMAAINEAYRVLGDPVRRRHYDAEIVAPPVNAAPFARAEHVAPHRADFAQLVADVTPARFPWKFMAVLATIGIGVIVAGLIFTEPGTPAQPDNILRSDDCVDIGPALDAVEVACAGPHDAVVRALVPFGDNCPGEAEGYRDRQGMGTACVVRLDP